MTTVKVIVRGLRCDSLQHDIIVGLSVIPLLLVAYLSFAFFETPMRRWISALGRVSATEQVILGPCGSGFHGAYVGETPVALNEKH